MLIYRVRNALHTEYCEQVPTDDTGLVRHWIKDRDDFLLILAASVFLDQPLSACETCKPERAYAWPM